MERGNHEDSDFVFRQNPGNARQNADQRKIQRSLDAKGLSALLPFGRSGRYIIRLTNLIRSVGKAECRGRVDLRLLRRFADGKVRVQQLQSQLVSCFFRLFFALSLRF